MHSTTSPCKRVFRDAKTGAMTIIASSDGFFKRAFTRRAFPQPWMLSKHCNLRMLATITSLVVDHASVPRLPFSTVQCLKRCLVQHKTCHSESMDSRHILSLSVHNTPGTLLGDVVHVHRVEVVS